jgi:molybdenum cofactor biosynthesis protein B
LAVVSVPEHRRRGAAPARCGVVTVSDTRTEADDHSGQRIQALLREQGHHVEWYQLVRDEPDRIRALLRSMPAPVEVVICTGGTGLAARDSTYEAIAGLLDKEITGFGELFRMLSYEQIGAAAMLSRATAGVVGATVVFSLPGSTAGVELAMTKLILPELGHIVGLVRAQA